MNIIVLEQRFRQDPLPRRLGNIAANLARIGGATLCPENWPFVSSNIRESKYFIEWTVPELQPGHGLFLVGVQVQLAQIEQRGRETWTDPASENVRLRLRQWSGILIELMMAMQSDPDHVPATLPDSMLLAMPPHERSE